MWRCDVVICVLFVILWMVSSSLYNTQIEVYLRHCYVCGGAETVVVYGGCKLEKIFVAGLARNTTLPILLAI